MRRWLRRWWQDGVELVGFGVVIFAAWDVYPTAGYVAAGLILLWYGNARR